jgi:hypothetical protein
MTRISKKGEKRSVSPKRPKPPSPKTGKLKDNLKKGYKEHNNSISGDAASKAFIPRVQ